MWFPQVFRFMFCFVLNHIYLFIWGMGRGMHVHQTQVWRLEDNFRELVFSFHCLGPRNHTQDLRFDIRCLYLLSHLPGSDFMSSSLTSNPHFTKTFRWSYVVFLFLLLSGPVDEKNVHQESALEKVMGVAGRVRWHPGLWMGVQSQSPTITFSSSAFGGMHFSCRNKTHP